MIGLLFGPFTVVAMDGVAGRVDSAAAAVADDEAVEDVAAADDADVKDDLFGDMLVGPLVLVGSLDFGAGPLLSACLLGDIRVEFGSCL